MQLFAPIKTGVAGLTFSNRKKHAEVFLKIYVRHLLDYKKISFLPDFWGKCFGDSPHPVTKPHIYFSGAERKIETRFQIFGDSFRQASRFFSITKQNEGKFNFRLGPNSQKGEADILATVAGKKRR